MAVHNETLGAAIAICGVGGGGGGGGDITVDSALSKTSRNPVQNKVITAALEDKIGREDIDALPIEGSENPVQSGGVYAALMGNLDPILPSILNAENYVSLMKLWFKQNGAAAMTDFSSLCDRWYTITRTGWTGGTRFYHATTSMASEGTKVGDNADMVAVPSTNDTAGRDDYQDVPLFKCLDCNWILDENGKPHITAIEGVCGNFERYDPEKLVGVIQMVGWCKYVDDAENDTYTYMYTDDASAEGYAPLPEAVNLDGTVRSWVVHGKYLSGDDYGCYSGARPWAYTVSHNSALTNYHTKWGDQYGGKTSADDAFLKLMFFLKYGSLSADGILQGCVVYNFQYAVAVEETGVERVILTAAQANNIKIGSTVMVGNPTTFSSGTTLNIDRNQAGMRAKVDRKKVARKETFASGNVAVYIDNGGVTFDTTANVLQGTKNVGPVGVAAIDDAVGGVASSLTVNIEPVQSGSGDPSPDNVRPISGWTGAHVTVNGNTINIVFPSESGIVYSGTLDVTNGKLVVDKAFVEYDGSADEIIGKELNGQRFVFTADNVLHTSGRQNVICNMGKFGTGYEIGTAFASQKRLYYYSPPQYSDTIVHFREWLNTNPIQFVYSLDTPVNYQLTPQEITLLSGSNTISANCGDVTLLYTANIPAPTYLSTSPWYTGACDDVRGADGSPSTPGNGSKPYILQGVECALGGHEMFSDTIIKYYKDNSDKYHLTYYICRDASKYSTDITTDYSLVGYEVDCPASNSWQYISEHERDENFPEACFPHLVGCTSSQRTKDGMYIRGGLESTCQYLSLGALNSNVAYGGLSFVNANNSLGTVQWYILARLSATGNRGIYNGGEG